MKQVTRKTIVTTVEGGRHTVWEVARKTGTAIFTYSAKKIKYYVIQIQLNNFTDF